MDVKIETTWKSKLKDEFEKEYFLKLTEIIREEYKGNTIYPHASLIFNAFNLCPFQNVKAVIPTTPLAYPDYPYRCDWIAVRRCHSLGSNTNGDCRRCMCFVYDHCLKMARDCPAVNTVINFHNY